MPKADCPENSGSLGCTSGVSAIHCFPMSQFIITVPAAIALGKLRAELESVGNALNCDIDLDPA
jgi:hypothetical protein